MGEQQRCSYQRQHISDFGEAGVIKMDFSRVREHGALTLKIRSNSVITVAPM